MSDFRTRFYEFSFLPVLPPPPSPCSLQYYQPITASSRARKTRQPPNYFVVSLRANPSRYYTSYCRCCPCRSPCYRRCCCCFGTGWLGMVDVHMLEVECGETGQMLLVLQEVMRVVIQPQRDMTIIKTAMSVMNIRQGV
ncbi:hypothetical protein E2C01_003614 [Portunus trituberculatus]|uniref:Uncharacterized protein n=1 Tax=Portunus trituberculatus TaxID=210409 RepID=A0A5B7CP91_PORTR|nr:hypothetical protein [Portunus trituberculatus]